MIVELFRRPSVIARHTQSPAAPYIDALVLALRGQGYAAETIKHYVLCTEKLCCWLDEQHPAFTDVNEALVNRYTTGLPRRIRPAHTNGIPHQHAGGPFHLVAVLRQAHIIPPLQPATPVTQGERWLARYGDHLNQRQGAAWSTCRKCLHYVHRLIEFRFPGVDPDWSALDASDIVNFLAGQARHGKGAVKTAASAVRSLLRFLVLEGTVQSGLEATVPPLPRWRLSGLPRYLTAEQVDHVLKACRQSCKSPDRNTAVLLAPPIQMSDALSRNVPKLEEKLEILWGNCNAHARRRFVEVTANFPQECRFVLESLREVYRYDAEAEAQGLTPEARLRFHQEHTRPVMDALQTWFEAQFAQKKVEPNSGLGEAITYCLKRWDRLTLFLREAGAPLDSNIVERALKKCILHRRNSLFYKTANSAEVDDLFMSLIHTCELNAANPFDYLTELQKHAEELAKHPAAWMPWNYRETLAQSGAGGDSA